MLANGDAELLTAYVDGELSMRQRKAVQRLLQKSGEARELLRKLQADAEGVRQLPRPRLGTDFPFQVMQAIVERGLVPVRPVAGHIRTNRWPAWVGWATAAAALVSVGLLSYASFPLLSKKERRPAALVRKPDTPRVEPRPRRDGPAPRDDSSSSRVVERPWRKDQPKPDVKDNHRPPNRKPPHNVPRSPRKDVLPVEPEPEDQDMAAEPKPELGPIRVPNLSFVRWLPNLQQSDDRAQLLRKLKSEGQFQVHLFCSDPGAALGRLGQVLPAHGLALLVDGAAQPRLKSRGTRTNYVLYVENVRPETLVAVLRSVAVNDWEAYRKKKTPLLFKDILVASPSEKLHNYFTRLLDPTIQTGPANGPPLRALVLAFNEDNSPVNPRIRLSPQIKEFRQTRQGRRPGTIKVVLMLSRG
jgi:hypothetical protein